MKHPSPLSLPLKKLIANRFRKSKAIASVVSTLKGKNNKLYFLIISDLLYRFNDTQKGCCRSQIKKHGRLWSADSYKVLTERYNELLEKTVSEKTVKRCHEQLKSKGLVHLSRHFFDGKNVLHRSVDSKKMEEALLGNEARKQVPVQPDSFAAQIRELTHGTKNTNHEPDTALMTYNTRTELNKLVEETIVTGNALLYLGDLSATSKRPTQQARARIRRLVEMKILGPLFIESLAEAWRRGEFDQSDGEMPLQKLWPDWLDVYYPNEDPMHLGLAADWFMSEINKENCPWITERIEKVSLLCHEQFKRVIDEEEEANKKAEQVRKWKEGKQARDQEDLEMEDATYRRQEEDEELAKELAQGLAEYQEILEREALKRETVQDYEERKRSAS